MSPEDLFGLASALVLPGWAILVLGPRRWPWLNAVPLIAVPAALSVLYAVLILTRFAEAASAGGGYGSLAEVRALFSSDWLLLAGWAHYLAFDLLVGAWVAARMDRAGIGRLVQGAVLPTVFLFGPLGLILALAIEAGLLPLRRAETALSPVEA